MNNFRTYQLALELNRNCKDIQLKGPFKNQFERAVLSIALNLSEGSARKSVKERLRFFEIALGSTKEVQTIVELQNLNKIRAQVDRLAANCYCLCRALRQARSSACG